MLVSIYITSFASHPQDRKDTSNGEQTPFQALGPTCQSVHRDRSRTCPLWHTAEKVRRLWFDISRKAMEPFSKGHFHDSSSQSLI